MPAISAWLIPLAACAIVMGVVIWRVRVWAGQGDGLAALILWCQGLFLCLAIVVGWALGSGGGE